MRVKFKIRLSGFFSGLRYKILTAAHFTALGDDPRIAAAANRKLKRAINLKDGL